MKKTTKPPRSPSKLRALSLMLGTAAFFVFSASGCVHRVIPTKKIFQKREPKHELAPTSIQFQSKKTDTLEVQFLGHGKCLLGREAGPACSSLNPDHKIENLVFEPLPAQAPLFQQRLEFDSTQGEDSLHVRIEIRGKKVPLTKTGPDFEGLRISRNSEPTLPFFATLTQDLKDADQIEISSLKYEVFLNQDSVPVERLQGFQAWASLFEKDSDSNLPPVEYALKTFPMSEGRISLSIQRAKTLSTVESVQTQTEIQGAWGLSMTTENCFYPEAGSEWAAICF